MNNSYKTVIKDIKKFSKDTDEFLKKKFIDESSLNSLLKEFDRLSAIIFISDYTPDTVKDFLSAETLSDEVVLPDEFLPLCSILKLRKFVSEYYKEELKKYLMKEDYNGIISIIATAIKVDIKNCIMAEYIADLFIKNELYSNLIELYKMMLVYTVNPMYFEKIGDVYVIMGNFHDAIDSYLNCAESIGNYVQIYEKLAETFGKINDNDSRLACLNHIKLLGGSDA